MSPRATPKKRRLLRVCGAIACAVGLGGLCGCLAPEEGARTLLHINNPEIAAGLDSLILAGINTGAGDTLLIRRWLKGQAFPAEVTYPPGLEAAFTLLAQGYKDDVLVYQSRTRVAGDHAGPSVRDFRRVAPALADVPVALTARVKDAITLEPAWEDRPGMYRQPDSSSPEIFTPDGTFAWTRDGRIIGRDSILALGSLALADSGAYVFTAGNSVGQDSMLFMLRIRHMLPRIAVIKAQAAIAGRSLTVKPSITRSDSLRYRWTRGDIAVSSDSILAFAALSARDTGTYQLAVTNASDTTETAVSNRFTVGLAKDPADSWLRDSTFNVGAQANSSLGTALDLDQTKAMKIAEAKTSQGYIDLVFVYTGSLKFMSAVAAKSSGLDYASGFEDAKIVDVKFMRIAGDPLTPDQARAKYNAGPVTNAIVVAEGQTFLVKTTDGNLARVKIESIQGGTGAAASATVTVGRTSF